MVGQRFDYQGYTQGMKGGLSLYPHGGVVEGLLVSPHASPVIDGTEGASSNTALQIAVTAGMARIDGQLCTLAANVASVKLQYGVALDAGTFNIDIWLNPVRAIKAVTALPGTATAGDKVILVKDMDSYYLVDGIYEAPATNTWALFDVVSKTPPGHGHNNLPLNDVVATIDNSATLAANLSFSVMPEKAIYHKTGYPIGLSSPGAAYLRQPAGIKLATITLVDGVATATTYGDEVRLAK